PAGGTYTTAQEVTLSTATSEAYIRFTVDGTTPTSSSMLYSGGTIPVGASYTLKAIAIKSGMTTSSVSSATYVINAPDISWQSGITYGSMTDAAGKTYKTVTIGTQNWMAENLNFKGIGTDTLGVCLQDKVENCKQYGRLYTWSEVMQGVSSSSTSPSNVRGICPTGWHVPSDPEWTTLGNYMDASGAASATKLKSISGWNTNTGTDSYGFRALPGASRYTSEYDDAGASGLWWSATESDKANGKLRLIDFHPAIVSTTGAKNSQWVSLRCVQD
ncbi:MAG: Chitodextrinase precursor, partial [Fibrobacterota bacterium]